MSPEAHALEQQARIRLLLVDDDEAVRGFLARALGDAGYEVALAADGPEALHIANRDGPFDLSVIDLLMPLMNGDEVARLLRRAYPDIKVLYFTGYSDRLLDQTPILAANEAFLDKPAGVAGLLEAVSLLLFGHLQR